MYVLENVLSHHQPEFQSLAGQRKVFYCVSLKQRIFRQRSVIQACAFQLFREQPSYLEEVACFPYDEMSFALYFDFFATAEFSLLHTRVCLSFHKLRAHNRYGFPSACDLVRNVLQEAKVKLGKLVSKSVSVTPEMILRICDRFASPYANLIFVQLHFACMTVSFCDTVIKIYLLKSKTDVYRIGAHVFFFCKNRLCFLSYTVTDTFVPLIQTCIFR